MTQLNEHEEDPEMNRVMDKIRLPLALLPIVPMMLLVSACNVIAWASFPELPGLPVCTPFALDRAGSQASVDLTIVREYHYQFLLQYHYDAKNPYDADRVFVFLKPPPNGERLPFTVRLEVIQTDTAAEQVIFAQEKAPKSYSSAAWGVIQEIVTSARLKPGKYRAILDSLQGAPAFKEVEIDFCVTYRGPK